MVNAFFAMRHFHEPAGFNDSNDPTTWGSRIIRTPPMRGFVADRPCVRTGIGQPRFTFAASCTSVDGFLEAAHDARLGIVAVAVVMGWPSARGLSIGNIADQLG